MKFKYFVPLLTLEVPNVVISALLFIYDEPPKMQQLIGYIVFNVFVCLHYYFGVRAVLKDVAEPLTRSAT